MAELPSLSSCCRTLTRLVPLDAAARLTHAAHRLQLSASRAARLSDPHVASRSPEVVRCSDAWRLPFARALPTARTLGLKLAAARDYLSLPSCMLRAAGAKAGVPEMAWLKAFLFRRWQLPQAGAEASGEALQANADAPVVCVVPAREVEDSEEARSASGSSPDQAKTTAALLQHNKAAIFADEISQLSTSRAPHGASRSLSLALCLQSQTV